MKILLVNKFYYRRGGAENYLLALEKLLKQHGHEVAILAMRHPDNLPSKWQKYFPPQVELSKSSGLLSDLKTAAHYFYSPKAGRYMAKLLDDFRPDVVHLQNFSHQLTPAVVKAAKDRKIPTVWTLHDYQIICPRYRLYPKQDAHHQVVGYTCGFEFTPRDVLASLEQMAVQLYGGYDWIDAYISPSKFLAKICKDWGVNKKISHISNFIDLNKFRASDQVGDYFVFAGRLVDEKGVATLIKAALNVGVKLKIAGRGPDLPRLKKLAKSSKLISFVGHLSETEIKKLISQSRAVVVPSEWAENNPLSILEAQALAKPIIGARVGGIPELITDDVDGWLFNPGDVKTLSTILRQANHLPADTLRRFGKRADSRARSDYSSERHYKKLLSIYRAVIKK